MPDPMDDRLTRLEEGAMFAERRLEELHEEVLLLAKRLDALAARVGRLEQASAGASEASGHDGPEPDPPSRA